MHVQPLTHPTLHKAPLTTLPDRLMPNMVAASNLDPYPGMNASFGSSAVVDPLAPQTLDTIPWDVYTDSSGDLWQQQSMLCKNMQAHDTSEHISEENRITDSMTLGVPGHTNGTSRALHWQRDDNGTLAHAQVCVEDQIRDSYVIPLMERFPTENSTLCGRMTLLWPPDLPLVIHNVGISTLNVQEWIQKNHAPVSRINCAPGTDNRDFNDLVKSLRNCGGVSFREVSTNLLSHALIVCDCMVGSRRQLSGTAAPRATWHASALCSVSCQRRPGATDVSIA